MTTASVIDPSAGQLELEFGAPPATLDTIDAYPAIASALLALRRWRDWPVAALCLSGPEKGGLTTLAEAWAASTGGRVYSAEAVTQAMADGLDRSGVAAFAVDRADLVDERALLSVLNIAASSGRRLLITSRTPPASWTPRSKDLASRLAAMAVARIDPPDEPSMRSRLRAALRRRHMRLPEAVADYLCIRLERSYAEVEAFAAVLADLSVRSGRPPSTPLARQALIATGRSAPGEEG